VENTPMIGYRMPLKHIPPPVLQYTCVLSECLRTLVYILRGSTACPEGKFYTKTMALIES